MAVFIAGTGAVCAAGNGVPVGFGALVKSENYLKSFPHPDLTTTPMPLCAQVECDLEILAGREGMYKTLALALVAADEAMAALPEHGNLRLGVVAATTVGGISQTEHAYKQFRTDPAAITPLAIECAVHEPVVLSSELCRRFSAYGFHTVSTACSSSLHAIGMAKRMIEREYYDACLVVGADALCITTVRGFGSLTLLDPNGCRPFDKTRAGISLGEGAGAMLLVGPQVLSRCPGGALAGISGWGASSDCFHMTAPHPDGEGARSAIEGALEEARLPPEAISAVISHGTGTPDNDKSEIAVLKSVFQKLPPFCSLKRVLGHTLAASGILEAVFAVTMLHEEYLPATAGFSEPDEEIGAIPFTGGTLSMRHILKNAFGFGGNNATCIISRLEDDAS